MDRQQPLEQKTFFISKNYHIYNVMARIEGKRTDLSASFGINGILIKFQAANLKSNSCFSSFEQTSFAI